MTIEPAARRGAQGGAWSGHATTVVQREDAQYPPWNTCHTVEIKGHRREDAKEKKSSVEGEFDNMIDEYVATRGTV